MKNFTKFFGILCALSAIFGFTACQQEEDFVSEVDKDNFSLPNGQYSINVSRINHVVREEVETYHGDLFVSGDTLTMIYSSRSHTFTEEKYYEEDKELKSPYDCYSFNDETMTTTETFEAADVAKHTKQMTLSAFKDTIYEESVEPANVFDTKVEVLNVCVKQNSTKLLTSARRTKNTYTCSDMAGTTWNLSTSADIEYVITD